MDRSEIEKLRRLRLTSTTGSGAEAVHVSAQFSRSLALLSRDERMQALRGWEEGLSSALAAFGGEVLPDSLSLSGQTVEALIPIDAVDRAEAALGADDVRLDLVTPRQSLPGG